MSELNYQLLIKNINFDVAIDWFKKDCPDDFFPDTICYKDIQENKQEYIEQRKHRFLQIDSIASFTDHTPKKNGLLREAIWLHPTHRILYLAALHHLLPKLDSKLLNCAYSYRHDSTESPDEYPFERRMERWKLFRNDFREACLDSDYGDILLTDIAYFYDHINISELCNKIRSLLGSTLTELDECFIGLLCNLLNLWGHDGYSIPQNYDPSSFLGSLYLHNIDYEMVTKRYRYFRWVDDMRIVAKNKNQAYKALHDLQNTLARYRLFLASDKTVIIERDSNEFAALLDVEDDVLISKAEDAITTGYIDNIKPIIEKLLKRFEFHSSGKGDDSKFRAFANRLLDASDFIELKSDIYPKIRKLVLPRLRSHPYRTDYWVKLLSVDLDENALGEIEDLLIINPSVFSWQRFHLWRMLLYSEIDVPRKFIDKAKEVIATSISDQVTSQAILCIGKFGDNTDREWLFTSQFNSQKSYLLQRTILIAIQELPKEKRESFYTRAMRTNSEHKQLIEFLQSIEAPFYGIKKRQVEKGKEVPRKAETKLLRGVGLIKGKKVRYRLSYSDFDY